MYITEASVLSFSPRVPLMQSITFLNDDNPFYSTERLIDCFYRYVLTHLTHHKVFIRFATFIHKTLYRLKHARTLSGASSYGNERERERKKRKLKIWAKIWNLKPDICPEGTFQWYHFFLPQAASSSCAQNSFMPFPEAISRSHFLSAERSTVDYRLLINRKWTMKGLKAGSAPGHSSIWNDVNGTTVDFCLGLRLSSVSGKYYPAARSRRCALLDIYIQWGRVLTHPLIMLISFIHSFIRTFIFVPHTRQIYIYSVLRIKLTCVVA